MIPPMKMCAFGHAYCPKCFSRVESCPNCQGPKLDTRNIPLERLFEKLTFPCLNYHTGCKVVAKGPVIAVHQRRCRLETYTCPLDSCYWTDRYSWLENHIWTDHLMMEKLNKLHILSREERLDHWNSVTKFDRRLFVLYFENGQYHFSVKVYLMMGTPEDYYFELSLYLDFETKMFQTSGECHLYDYYSLGKSYDVSPSMVPPSLLKEMREEGFVHYKLNIIKKDTANQ